MLRLWVSKMYCFDLLVGWSNLKTKTTQGTFKKIKRGSRCLSVHHFRFYSVLALFDFLDVPQHRQSISSSNTTLGSQPYTSTCTNIPIRHIDALSFTCGKATSGIGTFKNRHNGSQPSRTVNSRSFSLDTLARTFALCFSYCSSSHPGDASCFSMLS